MVKINPLPEVVMGFTAILLLHQALVYMENRTGAG